MQSVGTEKQFNQTKNRLKSHSALKNNKHKLQLPLRQPTVKSGVSGWNLWSNAVATLPIVHRILPLVSVYRRMYNDW